jgi:S-adenosylmethionine:tRNA ribosyltransferase-isomerase
LPSESAGGDPADLRLSSYDFPLPQERIAQRPVEPRHGARLLVVDPAGAGPAPHARHLTAWDLQQELRPGDLLVVNDTRVLRARLEARRPGGGAVELLVLEPWPAGAGQWLCLARPAKKLRPGDCLEVVAEGQPPLTVAVVGSDPSTGGRILQFHKQAGGGGVLGDDLAQVGGGMRALFVLGALALGAGIVWLTIRLVA